MLRRGNETKVAREEEKEGMDIARKEEVEKETITTIS